MTEIQGINPNIDYNNIPNLDNYIGDTRVRRFYDSLSDKDKRFLFRQLLSEEDFSPAMGYSDLLPKAFKDDGSKSSALKRPELGDRVSRLKEIADQDVVKRIAQISKGQLVALLEDTLEVIYEYFEERENPVKDIKILRDPEDSSLKFIEILVGADRAFESYEEALEAEAELGREIDQKVEVVGKEGAVIVPLMDGVDNLPLSEE